MKKVSLVFYAIAFPFLMSCDLFMEKKSDDNSALIFGAVILAESSSDEGSVSMPDLEIDVPDSVKSDSASTATIAEAGDDIATDAAVNTATLKIVAGQHKRGLAKYSAFSGFINPRYPQTESWEGEMSLATNDDSSCANLSDGNWGYSYYDELTGEYVTQGTYNVTSGTLSGSYEKNWNSRYGDGEEDYTYNPWLGDTTYDLDVDTMIITYTDCIVEVYDLSDVNEFSNLRPSLWPTKWVRINGTVSVDGNIDSNLDWKREVDSWSNDRTWDDIKEELNYSRKLAVTSSNIKVEDFNETTEEFETSNENTIDVVNEVYMDYDLSIRGDLNSTGNVEYIAQVSLKGYIKTRGTIAGDDIYFALPFDNQSYCSPNTTYWLIDGSSDYVGLADTVSSCNALVY